MASGNSKSSLVAAIILIVAVIVGAFVWQPAREQVLSLESELVDAQAGLVLLETELADLVLLDSTLPVAESERDRILEAVPNDLAQDELIRDLDDIASSVDIDLTSMTFSLQSVQGLTADVVSISASFSGLYVDLLDLLEAIETNDRLFKVNSIGVQLGDVTDDGEQLMTFSVTLEAYYQ
jgi:Tfp pilus assembly protein PilO